MNVYSMTGYGKSETLMGDLPLSVEIKSVNNRFLEISMKLPKELNAYEIEIKKRISKEIKRGSLTVGILLGQGGSGNQKLTYDAKIVSEYKRLAEELSEDYGFKNDLSLSHLTQLPEVLQTASSQEFSKEQIDALFKAVDQAIVALKEQRGAEGANLEEDLKKRIKFMDGEIQYIEANVKTRQSDYKQKLEERLKSLLEDKDIEESRFVQEIAYMADKMDITEEIVRYHSHNKLFLETLAAPGPHGKRLNFILQEMGREANTLSTKSHFVEFQHRAIGLKEEIETIREQIMNIE